VVDARAGPSLKTTLKPKKVKALSGNRIKSNQISKLQKEFKRHSKFDGGTLVLTSNFSFFFFFLFGRADYMIGKSALSSSYASSSFTAFLKKALEDNVDLIETFYFCEVLELYLILVS
jgi:hypothetical protein